MQEEKVSIMSYKYCHNSVINNYHYDLETFSLNFSNVKEFNRTKVSMKTTTFYYL